MGFSRDKFITVSDMAETIRNNIWKIPRDIDFIVAIPRSGMLCASIIASHLNVPLIDINSFLEGKQPYGGIRLNQFNAHIKTGKILVVDDTCYNGKSMRETRAKIALYKDAEKYKITYMVVYLEGSGGSNVDLYLEDVRPYTNNFRDIVLYEWNILQHGEMFTRMTLYDMDGVLCKNPPDERNESEYLSYIQTAPPMFIPRTRLGGICTYRLIKNKSVTEKWLKDNGVSYNNIFMFNANTWDERNRSGITPWQYKADIYTKDNRFKLFVESDDQQAQKIATISKKAVYCIESNKLY